MKLVIQVDGIEGVDFNSSSSYRFEPSESNSITYI